MKTEQAVAVTKNVKHLPFVSEDQAIGHFTVAFCYNAAGESLILLIILPSLLNLHPELADFQSQCIFATTTICLDDI